MGAGGGIGGEGSWVGLGAYGSWDEEREKALLAQLLLFGALLCEQSASASKRVCAAMP